MAKEYDEQEAEQRRHADEAIFGHGPLPAPNTCDLLPDVQGFFSDREAVYLARIARGADVFEVGSWKGRSTVFAAIGGARRVVACDWWKGDAYTGPGWFWPEFVANVERHGVADKVVPIIARYQVVLPFVDLSAFDVLHYDADHDDQPTTDVLSAFASRAKASAAILCHDANYPNVRAIVDWVAADTGRPLLIVDRLAVLCPLDGRNVSPRSWDI